MAIDTREERQSSIGILMPFQPRGVEPDPGFDKGERQASATIYSGIGVGDLEFGIRTREERQTAVSLLLPFYTPGVEPDVGIDADERRASVHIYSAIDTAASGDEEDLIDILVVDKILTVLK